MHARRDAHANRLRLGPARARIGALERDRARGTIHDFIERHKDVTFDVVAACGAGLIISSRAEFLAAEINPAKTSATSEELFEEITETSAAAEAEFVALRTAGAGPPASLLTGRRLKAGTVFPARAELVVFLAVLRVAENFVSFVDFLELLLAGFFVPRFVGMILAREFAESFLDIVGTGISRDAEDRVVIFKFNRDYCKIGS